MMPAEFKKGPRALWFLPALLGAGALLASPFLPVIKSEAAAEFQRPVPPLEARVVAIGLRKAGAAAAVGFFHPASPIHSNPAFAEFTRRGRVLDPARVLVASNSNFGAPTALTNAAEGAVLSLDPDGGTIIVPSDLAASGAQVSAWHGRVQLFTAQSPRFVNAANLPESAVPPILPVSNPLGISINNAFGLPSFANAPWGFGAAGTVLTASPDGKRINDQGNHPAGRLTEGAVAAALLGSPADGRKDAVFAIAMADGSIVHMREEKAPEALVPPGTLSRIPFTASSRLGGGHIRVTRAGMIVNWFPDQTLFAADPGRNAAVAFPLLTGPDGFRSVISRRFSLQEFDVPVDLAPANPEVADPIYSSNTSLAPGSDMYIANRGNGTIVRMRQDGALVAVRRITLPGGGDLGPGRLNGIAVSPEARRIWLTVDGPLPGYPDAPGALLEIPAFGTVQSNARKRDGAIPGRNLRSSQTVARGALLFRTPFTPKQGLGPLYNAQSCIECHQSPRPGGMGLGGFAPVQRIGRRDGGSFDPLIGRGGPIARIHTVAELGIPCSLAAGPSALANLISTRNSPPLFGLGLIESIPDEIIFAGAARRSPGGGRTNIVRDAKGTARPGRFGWKADTASLEQFVAEAFRNELGMTNPLAPIDVVPPQADCGRGAAPAIKIDGAAVRAVAAFIASLPAALPTVEKQDAIGRILFPAAGCADCHTPALSSPAGEVPLYSDLLLHSMGPGLDDGIVQGEARGPDWRTAPLWGLAMRRRFLHDGRARSIEDAILAHDGEGRQAAATFRQLTRPEQDALLTFLLSL
jgi:mono/diheme cytochrome c family protein